MNKYISSLKIDFEPKFLLQTDLYPKFSKNQVDQRILRKVKMGLWVLNKISSQLHRPEFGTDLKLLLINATNTEKCPYLPILDIESGIGYGNSQVEATPFLDGIRCTKGLRLKTNLSLAHSKSYLFEKLQISLTNKESSIELTLRDLEPFRRKLGKCSGYPFGYDRNNNATG